MTSKMVSAPSRGRRTSIVVSFCQCYFNSEPAGHTMTMNMQDHKMEHGMSSQAHYCKFNNAFRMNHGTYGTTSLDGAKFWVAGDLGGDFSKGQMDWAVLTFDPAVTPAQRDGIMTVLGKLYPGEVELVQSREGRAVGATRLRQAG